MSRFITVPADVVPLLYSGLELEVWRLAEDLDQAFDTREENHVWFGAPLDHLDRTCELLRVIDWPADHPPTEATVEIDSWREILLGALKAELRTQRAHLDAPNNGPELRDDATRAIATIDGFLAKLPTLEAKAAEAAKPGERIDNPRIVERGIIAELLGEEHAKQWTRAELERELYDVEPQALTAALERLQQAGVVATSEDHVWAVPCVHYLDALELIGV